jgi:predicted enzyme related to lactoylglutathione lyase
MAKVLGIGGIFFKTDNLDEALKQVAKGGAEVIPKTDDYPYSRFGWFVDPAENRVELWQAPQV